MNFAAVRDAIEAADGGLALVTAEAGVGETVSRLRAATGEMVLLLIAPEVAPLERAMLLAAIGPLAIERAPGGRIGALDVSPDGAAEEVVAAARFLRAARSTTGQVLRVG